MPRSITANGNTTVVVDYSEIEEQFNEAWKVLSKLGNEIKTKKKQALEQFEVDFINGLRENNKVLVVYKGKE